MRTKEPMKIIEVLRLWEEGFSQREIAASTNCARSTVSGILQRCSEIGMDYKAAREKTDEEINMLVYPSCNGGRPVKEDPDWASIQKRLESSKRINLQYFCGKNTAKRKKTASAAASFMKGTAHGKQQQAKMSLWCKHANPAKNCSWTGWATNWNACWIAEPENISKHIFLWRR